MSTQSIRRIHKVRVRVRRPRPPQNPTEKNSAEKLIRGIPQNPRITDAPKFLTVEVHSFASACTPISYRNKQSLFCRQCQMLNSHRN